MLSLVLPSMSWLDRRAAVLAEKDKLDLTFRTERQKHWNRFTMYD